MGIFALLLLSTLGVAQILRKPMPLSPTTPYTEAVVRFATLYPDGANILFVHHYHAKMEEALAPQPKSNANSTEYLAHIDLPSDPAIQFDATFGKLLQKSTGYQPNEQASGYFDMCLQRATGDHPGVSQIVLKCDNQDCGIDSARDKGLAVSCSADSPGSGAQSSVRPSIELPSLQPVFAAGKALHTLNSSLPYWTVPTLETLEAMTNRERVGYTRFDIDLKPAETLHNSDSFEYQVYVNGQPIFFNGFPPKVFRASFDPANTLHVSFGLENLSFSGADNGFEDLTIVFTFFKGQTQTIQQPVSREYVALRSAELIKLDSAVGSFQWSGSYKVPTNENKFEVLVNSVPKVEDAMKLKTSFDRLNASDGANPVVLVVRPPLRVPPYYGVAIGLVQPTKQVQFTFDSQQAESVCAWAKSESSRTRLIRGDLRIYQVSNKGYFPCR
jgi:hypothetical protein